MTHGQEVVSSNPYTVYWMDVSDASYYIQTIKITKIKVAKWGTPNKIFFKCSEIQLPEKKLIYLIMISFVR